MSCKSEGKPEAENPPGMAELPEGLELVARAEVKVLMEATGKVSSSHAYSHLLSLEICWGDH